MRRTCPKSPAALSPPGLGSSDNDPATCDLHNVSSWIVQDVSAEQMIAMVESTVEAGRWGIFCFHGIGGEHLPVATEALDGLVRYLRQREKEIWVERVWTIGRYLSAVRAKASMEG